MRAVITGSTDDRPFGYPVVRCSRCHAVWHLPQSVRRNEAEKQVEYVKAIATGWSDDEQGRTLCPAHNTLPSK